MIMMVAMIIMMGGGLEGGNYGPRSGEERPVLAGEVREERKGKKSRSIKPSLGAHQVVGESLQT